MYLVTVVAKVAQQPQVAPRDEAILVIFSFAWMSDYKITDAENTMYGRFILLIEVSVMYKL